MNSHFRIVAMLLLIGTVLTGLGPGIGAQGEDAEDGLVVISRVDSVAFPRVTLYVSASVENGLPLVDLAAADFLITEDGAEVAVDDIVVDSEIAQELRLVLAVDVSTSVEALAEIQRSVKGLIEAHLGPRDKMAILTFSDEVNESYPLTNNQDELKAALDEMEPAGQVTVLNQAALEAIELLQAEPIGRKAVIFLTDRVDNSGAPRELAEVIGQARQAGIPLYPVGFGGSISGNELEQMAQSSGGQAVVLANLTDLQPELKKLLVFLRQGYRLTFQSGLPADDGEHELTVGVRSEALRPARAEFEARSGPVIINLPGLSSDQMVAGLVNLEAAVTAPAPVVSVEYLLDDESLGLTTAPPYRLNWDSSQVPPGYHTLRVRATDEAGNTGQTDLNLNFPPSIIIFMADPQVEVDLGESFAVQADIEATTDISRVDLLVDGNLVDTDSTEPYSFSLDTEQYRAGSHEIALQVRDVFGRQAKTETTVQFRALPTLTWWERLRQDWRFQLLVMTVQWLAAIFSVILLTLIGVTWMMRLLRRHRYRTYALKLANLGNIGLRYELGAQNLMAPLTFQFARNGTNLPQWVVVPAAEESVVVTNVYQPAPAAVAAGPQPAAGQSPPRPVAAASGGGTGAGARATAAKAGQSLDRAQGCLMTISGMLGTLGYILPGSAGRSVTAFSQQLSAGERSVRMTLDAPARTGRAVGQLRDQVGQAVPARGASSQAGAASPAQTVIDPGPAQTGPAGSPVSGAPAARPELRQQVVTGKKQPGPTTTWTETPLVKPGEILSIDLTVMPTKVNRTQDCSFKIISRPLTDPEVEPLVEEGHIHVDAVPLWLRILWVLLFFVVAVAIVLGVVLVWALIFNPEFYDRLLSGGYMSS